jgi:hypothetical protein
MYDRFTDSPKYIGTIALNKTPYGVHLQENNGIGPRNPNVHFLSVWGALESLGIFCFKSLGVY